MNRLDRVARETLLAIQDVDDTTAILAGNAQQWLSDVAFFCRSNSLEMNDSCRRILDSGARETVQKIRKAMVWADSLREEMEAAAEAIEALVTPSDK